MDLEKIKELIEIVEESGITGLTIEEGKVRVEIKKEQPQQIMAVPMATNSMPSPTANTPVAQAGNSAASSNASGLTPVKSPMSGTFYAASSPDTPPFIKIGDRISVGQPICIVEAMKTFNEIESDVAGVVEKILVNNQAPVDEGQVLILVKE